MEPGLRELRIFAARQVAVDLALRQPEPRAELVTFQVVGLLPSPAPSTSGVDAVIGGLVGTNYGFGAVIPKDSLAALPEALRHDSLFALPAPETVDPFMGPMTQQNFIASFPRVDQARAAVADNSCMMNWTPRCETMSFSLQTYGTNYLAVDDIGQVGGQAVPLHPVGAA